MPYPFAYDHQLANAQVLKNIGAAELFCDADLSAEKLNERLQEYFCDNGKLQAMRKAYQKLPSFNSAAMLANEVLKLK